MTEYNYKHEKNREATHLKEEIQGYQKELNARDFIRTIGQNNKSSSFVPILFGILIAGLFIGLIVSFINSKNVPSPSPSVPSSPSIPELPIYSQ